MISLMTSYAKSSSAGHRLWTLKGLRIREYCLELVHSWEASSPPLVSLYLQNCTFSARAITACLRSSPELKSLRCRVSKQVAKALNSGRIAGQPKLCPDLQRTVLDTPVLASTDAETLVTVLEEVVCSRCPSTTGPSTCRRPGLRRLDLPNKFLLRTNFTRDSESRTAYIWALLHWNIWSRRRSVLIVNGK